MIKFFYNNLPRNNRGRYIEVSNIPHGINRDGNIHANKLGVSKLVVKLLS